MPAQTFDARLRITSFTAPALAGTGDNGKDLIFDLKCSRVQRDLSDSVRTLVMPRLRGGVTVPMTTVAYTIALTGVVDERGHSDHAVSSGVAHEPDMVDLEEAAVSWNLEAPGQLVHLELDYNGQSWRVYQGLIQQLTMVREAGRSEVDFILVFTVLWDPETNPGIREWAS